MPHKKSRYKEKECKHHGLTIHVLQTRGAYRCRKCITERTITCRRKIKTELLKAAGGKCIRCGYNKCNGALTFHHRNPNEKEFSLSQTSFSLLRQLEEIKKCDLLCANCHAEEHCTVE